MPKEVPGEWRKPYVCLRLPTGGGKTFLAARAVKVGAKFLERENNPLVLWHIPTDGMLGLPTATGTFYPDFFAELSDERVLLVGYKGEHLVEHEQKKKNIGERWEAKSGGKALFFWAVKKDPQGRDVHRQLEDKVGKS